MQECPFDQDEMVAAFAQHDMECNRGRGRSESADSGELGWAESAWLDAYVKLYDATGDKLWLDRLADHAHRIIAHRRDHFGDGGGTWVTATYSVARLEAEPLHNRGTGSLQILRDRVWATQGGADVQNAEYIVEFAGRCCRIFVMPARTLAAEVHCQSGRELAFFQPFRLALTGRPRTGDTFRVRTRAPGLVEYVVHQGCLLHPLALFVERVHGKRELQRRYAGAAEAVLDTASDLAARHEREWLDTGRGAGAYRFTPGGSERFPNRILPHNQYLALGRAYLVLSDVCRRRNFPDRARRMALHFRRSLQRTGNAFIWHYWDWVENGIPAHGPVEDTSHGHIDVGFAAEACRRGVVFRPADLRRFAATLMEQMWNGSMDAPRLTRRIDGTEGEAQTIRDWIDLGQWEPQVWPVYWNLFREIGRPVREIPNIMQGWARLQQGRNGNARKAGR